MVGPVEGDMLRIFGSLIKGSKTPLIAILLSNISQHDRYRPSLSEAKNILSSRIGAT